MLHSSLFENEKNLRIVEKNSHGVRVRAIKGSKKITMIPSLLSDDLSYLVAAIICDGHMRKDKYKTVLECTESHVIDKFMNKIERVFEVYSEVRWRKRGNKKAIGRVVIGSKPMVILFNKRFEIPRGKKSDIVRVPYLIRNSNNSVKSSFLEGVFDTDGGKRCYGLGLSTASKQFRDDIVDMLCQFGIEPRKDEWLNKKYNKRYYGFSFRPEAEVPKWSKGHVHKFL